MRNILLFILAVLLLINVLLGERVLIIQFELPTELIPYFDWLLRFPGSSQPPATPPPAERTPYPSRSL